MLPKPLFVQIVQASPPLFLHQGLLTERQKLKVLVLHSVSELLKDPEGCCMAFYKSSTTIRIPRGFLEGLSLRRGMYGLRLGFESWD